MAGALGGLLALIAMHATGPHLHGALAAADPHRSGTPHVHADAAAAHHDDGSHHGSHHEHGPAEPATADPMPTTVTVAIHPVEAAEPPAAPEHCPDCTHQSGTVCEAAVLGAPAPLDRASPDHAAPEPPRTTVTGRTACPDPPVPRSSSVPTPA